MLAAPVLAALVLAAPAAAAPAPDAPAAGAALRVLVMELEAVGVDTQVARAVDSVVLNSAAGNGVEVLAQSEIKTLARVEADKAQLGCDSSSCLAELAGAMGTRLVLFGSVSKLGKTITVSLSLYDNTTSTIARDALAVSDLGVLPEQLPPRVRALVEKATGIAVTAPTSPKRPPPAVDDSPGGLFYGGLACSILGGTAFLGGGALALFNELTIEDPKALATTKKTAQSNGLVGVVVGGVGLGLAVVGGILIAVE